MSSARPMAARLLPVCDPRVSQANSDQSHVKLQLMSA